MILGNGITLMSFIHVLVVNLRRQRYKQKWYLNRNLSI